VRILALLCIKPLHKKVRKLLLTVRIYGEAVVLTFIIKKDYSDLEIVPALGSVFLLIRRNLRHKKKRKEMKIYPEISLIIPVYNSADTLYGCGMIIQPPQKRNELRICFIITI